MKNWILLCFKAIFTIMRQSMTISATLKRRVKQFSPGQVFGYGDIAVYQDAPSAVVKAMGRLLKEGEIKRLSKGRFYKPKQGIFGDLKPSDSELLKTVLYKDGQLRGYVTGIALYNKLGLTTQLPRTITVAVEGGRQVKDFGTLRTKLIKSRAPVKAADVMLLQYLDVLLAINDIPDADANETLASMVKRFSKLDDKQVNRAKNLALNYYTSKVTALTGFLLEYLGKGNTQNLKKSLNPLTRFKIGLNKEQWPESRAWNIQ